jgi:hypothetical protein
MWVLNFVKKKMKIGNAEVKTSRLSYFLWHELVCKAAIGQVEGENFSAFQLFRPFPI